MPAQQKTRPGILGGLLNALGRSWRLRTRKMVRRVWQPWWRVARVGPSPPPTGARFVSSGPFSAQQRWQEAEAIMAKQRASSILVHSNPKLALVIGDAPSSRPPADIRCSPAMYSRHRFRAICSAYRGAPGLSAKPRSAPAPQRRCRQPRRQVPRLFPSHKTCTGRWRRRRPGACSRCQQRRESAPSAPGYKAALLHSIQPEAAMGCERAQDRNEAVPWLLFVEFWMRQRQHERLALCLTDPATPTVQPQDDADVRLLQRDASQTAPRLSRRQRQLPFCASVVSGRIGSAARPALARPARGCGTVKLRVRLFFPAQVARAQVQPRGHHRHPVPTPPQPPRRPRPAGTAIFVRVAIAIRCVFAAARLPCGGRNLFLLR